MPGVGGRQGDTLGVRDCVKVLCLHISLSLGSWRYTAISFRWGKNSKALYSIGPSQGICPSNLCQDL